MIALHSLKNIELAWLRSLRGENADYRAMLSLETDAFAWADKAHLLQIQKELRHNTYSPCEATRLYQPKLTGLLRPITLLRMTDIVVYQCIANVIAERAQKTLKKHYYKQTFSNILYSRNHPWFFKQYRYGYDKLNQVKKDEFKKGKRWLVEIDLTSFYDLIDHSALRTILSDYCTDETAIQLLFECLEKWTIHGDHALSHSHGIPQGPLPSSFLAECVLHLLDKTISSNQSIAYARYVDNITLMAKTERALLTEISRIDIKCRDLGLVAKIKTPLRKLKSIDEVVFSEPSQYQIIKPKAKLSPKQIQAMRRHFLKCFVGNAPNRDDPNLLTKLAYSLFRMKPDKRLLKRALNLLEQYPCLSAAINYHLQTFGQNDSIFSYLKSHVGDYDAYEYVQYNCLRTLYTSASKHNLGNLRTLCLEYIKAKHATYLRALAAAILGERKVCKRKLLYYLSRSTEPYLNQHILLALSNFMPEAELQTVLNTYIRKDNTCLAIIASYLLTKGNLALRRPINDVNPWATPILRDKGIIRSSRISDRIALELTTRHPRIKLPTTFNYHDLLKAKKYRVAITQLKYANAYFNTNPSLWITHLDNFHQMLLVEMFAKVGVVIKPNQVFGQTKNTRMRTTFPSASAIFETCHVKRSSSEVSHAYSSYLKSFSTRLTYKDRDRLNSQLHIAYQEIIDRS